jgi:hypothetical protein
MRRWLEYVLKSEDWQGLLLLSVLTADNGRRR